MVRNFHYLVVVERELEKKLRRIEALYQRPGTEGERAAAARALAKLKSKLDALRHYQREASRMVIREYEFEIFDRKI